tara:strand:+ start:488 stop:610 length:123 start_codon:yes stop_codon:yes gene_type:complete
MKMRAGAASDLKLLTQFAGDGRATFRDWQYRALPCGRDSE